MNHLFFAFAVVVYYVLHSTLASNTAKQYAASLPFLQKYYRLFYNAFAIFSFVGMAFFYMQIEEKVLFEATTFSLLGGSILMLLGIGILIVAFRSYDKAEFIGYDAFQDSNEPIPKLNTSGLNSYVRHPLYLGTFLVVWALVLFLPNAATLILSILTTLYIFIGAKLEEEKLIEIFGEEYIAYRKETSMLFPKRK